MGQHFSIETYDAPTIDDPVDHMEPIESEQSELAESLVRLVCWITGASTVSGVAARAYCLSETLGLMEPSLNWAQIADLCEVTREVVRQNSRELEDIFGLRPHHARPDHMRENSRTARNQFLQSSAEK